MSRLEAVLEFYDVRVKQGKLSQVVRVKQHPRLRHIWVFDTGAAWSTETNRFVGLGSGGNGYRRYRQANGTVYYMHQMVLETFDKPRPAKAVARHLNDIKLDNRLENLRWGTRKENALDAVANGRQLGVKGEDHPRARLTEPQVHQIRAWVSYGWSQAAVAKWFGVTGQQVSDIARRKAWPHVAA